MTNRERRELTSMMNSEHKEVRGRIRAMWENGMDTVDIARVLQIPEALAERELHVVLELKRAIVGSLGSD